MAARLPSWAWVTGLTVGATVAVVALAVQADKGPHPTAATARPSASASAHPTSKPKPPAAPAVPSASGTGRRIVYSIGQKRLWTVDASDKTMRTFAVWPGTVAPDAGTYTVSNRVEGPKPGSDGVQIEHIQYFGANKAGVNFAFSNAVDGSSPPPANGVQTSGIRMHKADGAALWAFGTTGTKVTVVE
ncbi:hypothetical protein AB0F77_04930 [Streptomyces sp. NPDC026672]|uniref:hypothetical protein n=1 Tax=unclassified Streptomyces TaxID=2593676 RepID=UPI0033F92F83